MCWLNTLEIKLFSAPYEDKDHAAKMEYFLPRFYAVLNDPEAYWADWQAEFTAVVSGFDSLQVRGSVDALIGRPRFHCDREIPRSLLAPSSFAMHAPGQCSQQCL